ncbi:FecR domain-containing protein [Terrimonas sp. NA20]|uniref:FecR domain-containing protein n=1 Tax=Terrimonas ginsenosidimutans TaxID=2908004 RepID=A0ABS9KY50_9BACT|nr:FecR family protein [Terrimonas ginsenosidimutans]MCG2617243.1 FecR domain-containing protein [Terrimonas ginsenosidimutans]
MTEERFWSLLSARLANEATPEELAELETYLKENPAAQSRTGAIENIWSVNPSISDDYKEAAFNKHLQRMSNHFSEPVLQYESDLPEEQVELKVAKKKPVFRIMAWITAAAAVAVLGYFTYCYFPFTSAKNSNALAQNTVSTKRGSKSKIQLPDGTQVWLNADSKITYNENFQGKIREVQLSGEAFFDVVHDEERPFVIHTSVIDVKVLGTAFNVRSYADEKNTETSLIRGSVEITLRNNPDKKIVLKPNDKLIVDNDEAKAETASPDVVRMPHHDRPSLLTLGKVNFKENQTTALETLWIKNTLAFDKESLEEIALKIERWYDVKVSIPDTRIRRTEYSGVFEDEDLEQVMEALRISGNFHYDINKKEITIRP